MSSNKKKAPKGKKKVAKGKITKKKKKESWLPDRQAWLHILGVLILTALVYSQAGQNEFTNWDDDLYVTENLNLPDYLDDTDLLFRDRVAANIHPFTMVTLAWDYKLGGEDRTFEDASIYHWQSVFWHLLNVILVYLFVFLISRKNKIIALVAALAFAIHPMHVESVAWVSGRKDVTYTFWFLLSLISYQRFRASGKWLLYGLSFLFAVLSCASKPAAVVIPVVLVLMDLFEGRNLLALRVWMEKLIFFALSVATGLVSIKTQGESTALEGGDFFNLWDKIQFGSYAFFYYIFKFIAPVNLSSFHPYPIDNNADLNSTFLIYPILVIGFAGLTYYLHRKNKVWSWSILFYFITIALVLQFITVGSAITSERYTYVPYIGLAYLLGYGLSRLFDKKSNYYNQRFLASGVLGAIALVFSYQSFQRVGVWKDSVSLWSNVIDQYDFDAGSYNNRGHAYRQKSEEYAAGSPEWNACLDGAKSDYLRSIDLKPLKNARAYSNLGMVYYKRNQDSLALQAYNSSIEQDSTYHEAWSNRGAIHARNGRLGKGLRNFNKALDLNPRHKAAYLNRGILHTQLAQKAVTVGDSLRAGEQYSLALSDFKSFLEIDPYNHGVHNSAAVTYQNLNQHAEAIKELNIALQLNPNGADYYLNRAISYTILGKRDRAMQDVNKARSLGRQPGGWLKNQLEL